MPDNADGEPQEQGVGDRRWVAALSNDGHLLERYAAIIDRVRRGILVGPAVGHTLDGQNGRINGVDLTITGELRRPLLTLAQFLVRLLRRPDRFRSRVAGVEPARNRGLDGIDRARPGIECAVFRADAACRHMGRQLPSARRRKNHVFLKGIGRFPGSGGNKRARRNQHARRPGEIEHEDGFGARLARDRVELNRTALPRPRVLLRVKLNAGLVGGFPRLLKRGGEHADNLLENGVIIRDIMNENNSAEKELEDYFNVEE